MPKFQVNWGPDEKVVDAATSADAWAVFADSNDLAARHPDLHERRIEPVAVKVAPVVPLVEMKPVTPKK